MYERLFFLNIFLIINVGFFFNTLHTLILLTNDKEYYKKITYVLTFRNINVKKFMHRFCDTMNFEFEKQTQFSFFLKKLSE